MLIKIIKCGRSNGFDRYWYHDKINHVIDVEIHRQDDDPDWFCHKVKNINNKYIHYEDTMHVDDFRNDIIDKLLS